MDIALVFPKSTFLIDPMVYPPLGLWYLAAQLEAQGHKTEFFDLDADPLPADGDFSQLWVSATSSQMAEVRKIGNEVKDWRWTSTVFGGAAPWAQKGKVFGLGFHLTVVGEADTPDAVNHVRKLAQTNRLQRDPSNLYLPQVTGMDHILPPVRRWSHKYHAYLEDRHGTKHETSTLFTSRGCPMACVFCESGRNGVIWDRMVRYEPTFVVEEQLFQMRDMGYTGAMFYDDILPLNKPRTLQIMALLKKYNFVWRCFLRTDVIAHQGGLDYLKEMAAAGLVEVLAGVESADNQIKANVHKGTTIEQDTDALTWCKQLGIKFKASVILGLPGETMDSMKKTRDWILTHRPDRVDVNMLIPFPGTPIVENKGQYDVYWKEDVPEEFWYKGPREDGKSLVGTSALTPEQIETFHHQLIMEIEKEGIPY